MKRNVAFGSEISAVGGLKFWINNTIDDKTSTEESLSIWAFYNGYISWKIGAVTDLYLLPVVLTLHCAVKDHRFKCIYYSQVQKNCIKKKLLQLKMDNPYFSKWKQ